MWQHTPEDRQYCRRLLVELPVRLQRQALEILKSL
jgi:hypothetical protein